MIAQTPLISTPFIYQRNTKLAFRLITQFRKMSDNTDSNQKPYHTKATGAALNTVKKHSKDHALKLYGSCFWWVSIFDPPSI